MYHANRIKRHFFEPPQNPVLTEELRKNIPRKVPAIHKYVRACKVPIDEPDLIKCDIYYKLNFMLLKVF